MFQILLQKLMTLVGRSSFTGCPREALVVRYLIVLIQCQNKDRFFPVFLCSKCNLFLHSFQTHSFCAKVSGSVRSGTLCSVQDSF